MNATMLKHFSLDLSKKILPELEKLVPSLLTERFIFPTNDICDYCSAQELSHEANRKMLGWKEGNPLDTLVLISAALHLLESGGEDSVCMIFKDGKDSSIVKDYVQVYMNCRQLRYENVGQEFFERLDALCSKYNPEAKSNPFRELLKDVDEANRRVKEGL